MNEVESKKYGLSTNYFERQSLQSKKFRMGFNLDRIKKLIEHRNLSINMTSADTRKKK